MGGYASAVDEAAKDSALCNYPFPERLVDYASTLLHRPHSQFGSNLVDIVDWAEHVLTPDERREALAAGVSLLVRKMERERTAKKEADAKSRAKARRDAAAEERKAAKALADGFRKTPEGKSQAEAELARYHEQQAQWREEQRQRAVKWQEDHRRLAEQEKARVRVEVIQELIAENDEFALSDGTRVHWADATAADHRQRADMLIKNAAGNSKTAALHLRAAEYLEEL